MSWGDFDDEYVKKVAGDFRCSGGSYGVGDSLLRLQPGGRYWHARHKSLNSWFSSSRWELVEAIGTWSLEPNRHRAASSNTKGATLRLCCELRHFASSHELSDRSEQGTSSLFSLLEDGQLALRYAVHSCPVAGTFTGLTLEGTDVQGCTYSVAEAAQRLGFGLRYLPCDTVVLDAPKPFPSFEPPPEPIIQPDEDDDDEPQGWCVTRPKKEKARTEFSPTRRFEPAPHSSSNGRERPPALKRPQGESFEKSQHAKHVVFKDLPSQMASTLKEPCALRSEDDDFHAGPVGFYSSPEELRASRAKSKGVAAAEVVEALDELNGSLDGSL
eukprot:TRINITY_DN78597_c0_g1_i1.p1 TRINITY_DN78597_c0_g1~~TRINITY_DN78597_c0_g1_i1.p1  ORF type:complete len:328 (-),score=49.27 TRINITY_DN78597_c0_g1_i1:81-1064(-)